MNLDSHQEQLSNKTFIFKIGNYKAFGGAETQSFILAKHLKTRYKARIIFLADNNEGPVKDAYLKEGFEAYQLNYRLHGTKIQKIIDTIKCIKLLRSFKPDFLLPYTSDNCKKLLNGWRYTGAKYAWWMQQDEGRELYKTKFEKWTIDQASGIISNSEVGMDFIQDAYDKDKSQMVHYNIEPFNVIYEDIINSKDYIQEIANVCGIGQISINPRTLKKIGGKNSEEWIKKYKSEFNIKN